MSSAKWSSGMRLAVGTAVFTALAVLLSGPAIPGTGSSSGTAWAASDPVDEAKAKSLEALDAIAKALQELTEKAKAEVHEAAEKAKESLQTSVDKACDAALHACQKVCGDDAKCLRACKEGRHTCQP